MNVRILKLQVVYFGNIERSKGKGNYSRRELDSDKLGIDIEFILGRIYCRYQNLSICFQIYKYFFKVKFYRDLRFKLLLQGVVGRNFVFKISYKYL